MVAAVEAAVMAAEGTPASPPRNGGLLSTHTQSSRSQVQPSKVMARSTGARRMREHSLRGGPETLEHG
mgnify:CR=1 FL=1